MTRLFHHLKRGFTQSTLGYEFTRIQDESNGLISK